MELFYVSSNPGKWESVKNEFAHQNIDVNYQYADLDEPEVDDITYISKEKARQAYDIVGKPVFVADSGFYIDNYPNNPGYPGIRAKRSGVTNDIENLLLTLQDVQDRHCHFLECVTFYDGEEYYAFYGYNNGTLSTEIKGTNVAKAKSRLWYLFIPEGYNKTLAEMTDEEIKESSKNTSATKAFLNWFKNEYLISKKQKIYTPKKVD